MKTTIIDLNDIETIWINLRKFIEKPLKALGINMRELKEEGLSSGWLDSTV